MFEEYIEDWLDVLILGLEPGDQSRQYDSSDWKEYFCVLERDPPAIRIFLDEQEYDDYQNYPSPIHSPLGRRPSFGNLLRNGPESFRRCASLGDLVSPERSSSPVYLFRRRLSSGIGNLLALGRLEKVTEERNSNPPKRWKINKSKRPKDGLSNTQKTGFTSQQQESATITDSVDLAVDGKVEVRAVHPSIIGHQYCFVISNSLETKYFSCRSGEEMSKWISSVKKALDPSRDLECRTDISLSLWIVEAKGLTNKKRYFCELLLDNVCYAKSSGKSCLKNDTLFWGEQFVFEDLPELSMIQINVYKDYDKKKKKDKSSLIGTIDIPTNSLALGQEMETWYPISLVSTAHNEGASLRIRSRYQRNLILPLGIYNELLEFLKNNYSSLCHFLESVLSAKAKDEIAKILVRILQSCGKAKEFLIDLVTTEMEKSGDDNLLFRGNSFATKAMDYYMKMVGEEYLEQTLGDFVKSVYKFEEDCEVDPSKVPSNQLEPNQENIKALVQKAWNHIVCSADDFPRELVDIFTEVRDAFPYASSKASCLKLISGTVFLRFLVPAILSPSLFGLAQEYPAEHTCRTLTLVAKVIQNLANGLRFDQSKEGYLEFMNYFIDDEKRGMREFLKNVSTKTEENDPDYNGCVDLGKELSAMQNALNEQIDKLDKEALSQLSPLQFVLETLNDACQNPDAVGVFNPNSLILSKHTLSANLYKKLATKTPVDTKLDHSKKASTLRTKPEFHDAELSDGREDPTRNIIIKETKKRNQRYYDMRSGNGLSRDSSEYSSESPRSRHGQSANPPNSAKKKSYVRKTDMRKTDVRKTDMRNRSNTDTEVRSPPPNGMREFPTSDLGEDFLSSGEGNTTSIPPLQKLTVRYVNPTSSAKSSGSSGGSKWTGSDYGSLPRNFERLQEDNEIEKEYVEANTREQKDESRRTPVSEPEDGVFARPRDYGHKYHTRSLEDIISVHSDPESTRALPRPRPRSLVIRDAETVGAYESKSLNVEREWKETRNAPGSPLLRRIDKFKRQSVSSSSSGGSLGAKTPSREMLERDGRSFTHHQSKEQTTLQANGLRDNDDHMFNKSSQPPDLSELRRELEDTKLRLFEKQRELNEERAAMKRRQIEIEEKLRREQDLKDKELRAVYERLSNAEQQLRDQQTEMEGTLKAKNVIIQAQEQRIKSLNTDYNKLLEALNQLQKTPSVRNMNIRITDNL